jgi:hypothetical protein
MKAPVTYSGLRNEPTCGGHGSPGRGLKAMLTTVFLIKGKFFESSCSARTYVEFKTRIPLLSEPGNWALTSASASLGIHPARRLPSSLNGVLSVTFSFLIFLNRELRTMSSIRDHSGDTKSNMNVLERDIPTVCKSGDEIPDSIWAITSNIPGARPATWIEQRDVCGFRFTTREKLPIQNICYTWSERI